MLTEKQSNESVDLKRDAWLEINLEAIKQNVNLVRDWVSCPIMGVVKGDAYGHGAVEVGRTLLNEGIDWLAVATAAEALELKEKLDFESQITKRLLILSPVPSQALKELIEKNVDLTVSMQSHLKDIINVAKKLGKIARIHLKIDSGMHRLGFQPQDLGGILDEIKNQSQLHLVSIYSHLARAGDQSTSQFQHENFSSCLAHFKEKISPGVFFHLANSEAARKFSFSQYDMVRIGLYLYGLEPKSASTDLKPALSLKAKINHITPVAQGEGAGYDWTFRAQRQTLLASIPVGYADGVPRHLSNKMSGLLRGKLIKQVGIISMDQMLFDVSEIESAKPGDEIVLISDERPELSLAHWSNLTDTITYELACALALRLPRIYKSR